MSFTSNYLALRKERNSGEIARHNTAAAPSGAAAVAATNTVTGYYSRPDSTEEDTKLRHEVDSRNTEMVKSRLGAGQTAKALRDTQQALAFLEQRGKRMSESGAGEDALTQLQEQYNSLYKKYRTQRLQNAAAIDGYNRSISAYKQSVAAYQKFRAEQAAALKQWRGTIRDGDSIQTELAALESQIEAQREADRAARPEKYEAVQDEKTWYEKLAVYLGGVQYISLPTYTNNKSGGSESVSAELQALLDKQALLKEEYDWSQYYKYADLKDAADFAEKSQYVSTANGQKRSAMDIMLDNYSNDASSGYDDPLYEYINGNKDAGAFLSNKGATYYGSDNAIGEAWGRATENESQSQQMTEDEIAIFNYLYATQGKDAAHSYYDHLQSDLNYRKRANEEAEWAEYAKDKPIAANVFSVAIKPADILSSVSQIADYVTSGEIDENASYNKPVHVSNAIRNKTTQDLRNNYGEGAVFAYQTTMSIADQVARAFASGGNSTVYGAIMASSIFSDTIVSAKDRGLSDNQAVGLGVVSAAAEFVTEKFSLRVLLDKTSLGKSAVGYILKNVLAEGSEEGASTLINTMADILISKEKSQWQTAINAYKADGKTEGQAFGLALRDQVLVLVFDVLGGAISGGVMAGGNVGINATGNKLQQSQRSQNPLKTQAKTFQETAQQQATEKLSGKKAVQAGKESVTAATERQDDDSTINPFHAEIQRQIHGEPQTGDNMIGGINNGNEAEGNRVLDGGSQWGVGTGTGEQAGRLEQSAKGSRRASQQRRTASARQSVVNAQQLETVSSLDVGVSRGTEDKTLRVMPENLWDDEMRATAEAVHSRTGKATTFVVGGILVNSSDGPRLANGVWTPNGIIIQADHMRAAVGQIADHEVFHDMSRRTPGLVREIEDNIHSKLGESELAQTVDDYIRNLRGTFDLPEDATQEQIDAAALAVLEEIWADAYAEVNRFGADTVQFAEGVREVVNDHVQPVAQDEGSNTEQTTGPPVEQKGEQFAIETLPDGKKYVRADRQVIFGNDPESWNEQIEDYINGKIRKGENVTLVAENGDVLTLTSQTAGKLADNHNSHGATLADDEYYVKANAAVHIDELAQVSTDEPGVTRSDVDARHGAFASGGWTYRTAYFRDFDGKYYRLRISVANGKNGNVVYNIGDIKERSFPTINGSSAKGSALGGKTSSEKMIPQNESAVKDKFSIDADSDVSQAEERRKPLTPDDLKAVPEYKPGSAKRTESELPDGYDSAKDFTADWERRAAKAKAERMRNVSKEDFAGTPALQKLGVKVENGVGLYRMVKQLIANDRSAKMIRKEARRAERRLAATEAERNFASGISAGIYHEADIPSSMDAEKVLELADYYWAEKALASDMIRQQRVEINKGLSEKMERIMRKVDDSKVKLPSGFTLNHRTPTRNMISIFGDEIGKELNAFLFDPVAVNEAERFRFVNRMYDQVRTFEDSGGKQSKLNKEERALVQQMIEGKAAEEMIAGMEMAEAIRNAGHNIHNGEDAADTSREFSLNSEERKLAVQYSRWLQTKEMLESEKVDSVKVDNAVQKYVELFDQFYDAINDFLVAHGYEPIGFIKGYTPHLQPESNQNMLNKALKYMGISPDVSALPSSIAGLTKNFKPNKRWNPYFLHRTSDVTQYDIATAFESYVDYMSDVLYHTDDIMRVRQAVNYFRKTYAPDNIRENLEWIAELRYGSVEEKANFLRDQGEVSRASFLSEDDVNRAMDEYVDKQYSDIQNTTKYSDMVVWMDDYANKLAGKQLTADRSMERTAGRMSLNVASKLTRCFARAQVAGNLSSALNQTAQIPQIVAENGLKNTAFAFKDVVAGRLQKASWIQESDYLTEKKGIHYVVSTPGEMVTEAMFKPLEFVDSFVATLAVRGRYLKEVAAGKSHKEAMRAADTFGRNVMGSRAKGTIPLAFQQKDIVSQMLHTFQVEAANSWEHLVVDLPKDFRQIETEKGKKAAMAALAGVIVKMLLAAFLLNRVDEELYGGTPAPYDLLGLSANFIASGEGLSTNEWIRTVIDNGWADLTGERLFDTDASSLDGEFNWAAAFEDAGYNIGSDIPYLRNAMALLGWGDETLPMIDLPGAISGISDAAVNDGLLSYEMGRQLLGIAGDILPGGRQIEKTVQGLEAVARGGKYKGVGDNARLQYPVEGTVGNVIKALLFGDSALSEKNAFYASELTGLSAKQTQVYEILVSGGADASEVYNAIQEYRAADNDEALTSYERGKKKRDIIQDLNISDQQKLEMYFGLTGAESTVEKFRALMDQGMSWDKVMDAYDKYSEIDGEEISATEKATRFAKWVDGQAYTHEQAEEVKNQFQYWNHLPAEAGRYEGFVDSGLSTEDAYGLTEELEKLEPQEGKTQVSDVQRWRTCVDFSTNEGVQLSALSSIMDPDPYAKVVLAYEMGIPPDAYVGYYEIRVKYDADKNGSYTQKEVKNAIDSMSSYRLTQKQKAVLWQLAIGFSSAKNNPYSSEIGQKVIDAWEKAKAEQDEEGLSFQDEIMRQIMGG